MDAAPGGAGGGGGVDVAALKARLAAAPAGSRSGVAGAGARPVAAAAYVAGAGARAAGR